MSEAAAGSVPHTAVRPLVAWSVLAVASVGVLLSGAELMVVAIALPSIVVDFGGWTDLARVSWIINAYLLAFLIAMPLAGRAADLWGARRLYVFRTLEGREKGAARLPGVRPRVRLLIEVRSAGRIDRVRRLFEYLSKRGFQPSLLPDAFYVRVSHVLGGRLPPHKVVRALLP